MSELILTDYKVRQDEDITSLEDEECSLWSKKEGTQTWEIRHEARFIKLHENLELKILGNMNFDFEEKFGLFPGVHFSHAIWSSRSQESNTSNGVQIRAEMKMLWLSEDNCIELKNHFEMISKFNLWIRNPIRNEPNFEFTHYHFGVSPPSQCVTC